MATSEKIRLVNVRLSFPRLFKPKSFEEGQDPRYEGAFILDPSDEKHAALIDTLTETAKEVAKEKFNGKIPKALKLCFGYSDGSPVKVGPNEYRNDPKEYDGYDGMFYITSANKTKPKVVHRDPNVEVTEESGTIYAGCYVNATITLWGQDNKYGKRINANLRAVQFVRDGDAFGVAPVDANEEFDEVEVDDDEPNWDD